MRRDTIRQRLVLGFVLVTLVSAAGVSVGSIIVGYHNGQKEAIARLESVAASKEQALNSWIQALQQELIIASQTEGEFERISVVLDLAQNNQYYDFYHKAVRRRLQGFVRQSSLIRELYLIDTKGRVVLSTDPTQEGSLHGDMAYYRLGMSKPITLLPFYSPSPNIDRSPLGRGFVITAKPIISDDGQPLGIIVGSATTQPLTDLLNEQTGLGETGKAYLVDSRGGLIAGARLSPGGDEQNGPAPQFIQTSGIESAILRQVNGTGIYNDYHGASVIGVYRWLPEQQLVLSVEQNLSEALSAVYELIGINLGIALAAMLLALFVSLFMTQSIAAPLVNLVETARQIAAGDLDRVASVDRNDEVKSLAEAFNSMTAQLRDLISGLEQRVKERTYALEEVNQALQQRAIQLETSVRVSREITSILAIDDLMAQVVQLIRNAFGYYRVHVFLLDREVNQLILRASSGGVEPQFQRLEIDQKSINTRALLTGEAQLVNDVTLDPYYLSDEHLPDTRSELIVPLRLGDQVIGTLDVHSTEMNAFTREDTLVIQSLGDQIAVAIENARLYDRSRELAILEERTRLARELHDSVTQSLYSVVLLTEGWRRLITAGQTAHMEDYLGRIGEIAHQALKEMRLLIHELRPLALESDGLLGALHQRLDAVEKRVGMDTRLLVDDLVDLPPHVEEGLYRIAQEALNNALKHAAAKSVTVHMWLDGEHLNMEVIDDGCGFELESASCCGGMGLISMQERSQQIKGELGITSAPGEGTRVKIRVPIGEIHPLQPALDIQVSERISQ